jgi:hypothetical protein
MCQKIADLYKATNIFKKNLSKECVGAYKCEVIAVDNYVIKHYATNKFRGVGI